MNEKRRRSPTKAGLRAGKPEHSPRPALVDPVARKAQGAGRALVRYRVYRVQLLDEHDNLAGGLKTLTDCLCQAGIIAGDDPASVWIQTSQIKVEHFSEQRTEIDISWPKKGKNALPALSGGKAVNAYAEYCKDEPAP
jgi:hypothetical protein